MHILERHPLGIAVPLRPVLVDKALVVLGCDLQPEARNLIVPKELRLTGLASHNGFANEVVGAFVPAPVADAATEVLVHLAYPAILAEFSARREYAWNNNASRSTGDTLPQLTNM